MREIKGIAASDGVAIAPAFRLIEPDLSFETKTVTDVDGELNRLHTAFDDSKSELEIIKQKAKENLGDDEAEVFEAHITILSDPEMIKQIETEITEKSENAEAALKSVTDGYIQIFQGMDDNEYMQQRATDVADITKRVMSHLLGVVLPDPALINREVVIVAHDLTPSDTAQFDRKYVKGIVSDLGGRTSHSAIMSRTLEIPAVVGTETATELIAEDTNVIVSGLTGEVIIDPTEDQINDFSTKQAEYLQNKAEWKKLKTEPTTSADGVHPILAANIGTPKDLPGVLENGAEGVGLYRTEFLYMDSTELPSEDDQFEAYREVVEGMQGKPVVIRTMDIGGDKELPYLPLPEEMNPFLGYRAIRISLDQTEIFRTQLRALLRASNYGQLWIMFPMIATLDEFRRAKSVYSEEREKMIKAGQPVGDIKLGIMIEIPASAVLADKFAKEVDFMSIGTNDLIQYSMAADRGNERVSYLYQPYNPAILRLVKRVVDTCHAEGKIACMCGEMAGDQIAVPILLGMGLDEFSMSATSILKTRSLIKRLSAEKMQSLAQRAVTEADTNEEVKEMVEETLKELN
ncbi:phosphoenolpyruvate--protein phosphotransferase [Lentilactobacillus kribbianus]|uniref:phosphoenolpyruvate--protein phosphotransferase n=1 Tax=Lentilactobacillus kribbianus TaxID=2729622 RepID=UPI001551D670|nr:phosphoenolpyruvate--protein phosphotransferase [Lentilactobacillus kribbianus]